MCVLALNAQRHRSAELLDAERRTREVLELTLSHVLTAGGPAPSPQPLIVDRQDKPAGGGAADAAEVTRLRRQLEDVTARLREAQDELELERLDNGGGGPRDDAETVRLLREARDELADKAEQIDRANILNSKLRATTGGAVDDAEVTRLRRTLEDVKARLREAQDESAAKEEQIARVAGKLRALPLPVM
jgi:hypothetical protein